MMGTGWLRTPHSASCRSAPSFYRVACSLQLWTQPSIRPMRRPAPGLQRFETCKWELEKHMPNTTPGSMFDLLRACGTAGAISEFSNVFHRCVATCFIAQIWLLLSKDTLTLKFWSFPPTFAWPMFSSSNLFPLFPFCTLVIDSLSVCWREQVQAFKVLAASWKDKAGTIDWFQGRLSNKLRVYAAIHQGKTRCTSCRSPALVELWRSTTGPSCEYVVGLPSCFFEGGTKLWNKHEQTTKNADWISGPFLTSWPASFGVICQFFPAPFLDFHFPRRLAFRKNPSIPFVKQKGKHYLLFYVRETVSSLKQFLKTPLCWCSFFLAWEPTTKINNFDITDLHMLQSCVPSNPGKKCWFKIIFLWCTNVWQQENNFVTLFMGGEFIRSYLYVKPQRKKQWLFEG